MSRSTPEDAVKIHLIDLQATIESMQDTMSRLLNIVGERSRCSACHKEIYWVRTKLGRRSLQDLDGVSHSATCPFAEKLRKQNLEKQKEQTNG